VVSSSLMFGNGGRVAVERVHADMREGRCRDHLRGPVPFIHGLGLDVGIARRDATRAGVASELSTGSTTRPVR